MAKKSLNLYIDEELKKEAAELFKSMYFDLSTAVSIFFRKAIDVGGFPFEIGTECYNKDTQDAFKEFEDMLKHPEKYKKYSSLKQMLEELENDKKKDKK